MNRARERATGNKGRRKQESKYEQTGRNEIMRDIRKRGKLARNNSRAKEKTRKK